MKKFTTLVYVLTAATACNDDESVSDSSAEGSSSDSSDGCASGYCDSSFTFTDSDSQTSDVTSDDASSTFTDSDSVSTSESTGCNSSSDGCASDSSSDGGPACGDGNVDMGEDCDDGNQTNGDGCNIDCMPSGQELWTDGANDGGDDIAWGAATDSAGNILIVGQIESGGVTSAWTRKYDPDGVELWTQTSNWGDGNDYGFGVAVDSMDNIIVTGRMSVSGQGGNTWTRKYDPDGGTVWTRTFNGAANSTDVGNGVAIAAADAIVVAGESWTAGQGVNIWVRRYDSDGTAAWTQTFNGVGNSNDYGRAVAVDSADNSVVAGETWVAGQGADAWIRKYDADGAELWTATYDNDASEDAARGVAIDSDNSIVVAGSVWTAGGQSHNVWVQKYDEDGGEVWTQTYNGMSSSEDRGRGIAIDSQGAIVVAGQTWVMGQIDDIWMRKYDADGNEMWTKTYNGMANSIDWGTAAAVDADDNIIFAGGELVAMQGENIWVRKYTP